MEEQRTTDREKGNRSVYPPLGDELISWTEETTPLHPPNKKKFGWGTKGGHSLRKCLKEDANETFSN